MIADKKKAIEALDMIESCIDQLTVSGGIACVRVGNAYIACQELKEYVGKFKEQKPEDEPTEDEKPTITEKGD